MVKYGLSSDFTCGVCWEWLLLQQSLIIFKYQDSLFRSLTLPSILKTYHVDQKVRDPMFWSWTVCRLVVLIKPLKGYPLRHNKFTKGQCLYPVASVTKRHTYVPVVCKPSRVGLKTKGNWNFLHTPKINERFVIKLYWNNTKVFYPI